ncbi:MAG: anaerobic ribonucleoside-triphosphate reductase activating protein [Ruminococcus sp.]|nr:anaerobic ribonucleoside-triphosphate reductase activating protein [Ruminococcus sp.]
MVISGMQKLTLLDYPGETACLIFTQGCNFRCPFCHNKDLLGCQNNCSLISEESIFEYLEKRKGLLDGVCITGGEPLLQKDIKRFIKKIKDMGYKVKLDTNGSNPIKLEELMREHLVDYVAMDIKNDFLHYDKTAGITSNIESIKKSIDIIENSDIDHEFRTTIVKDLHTLKELERICKYIKPNTKYYLQNYRDCNTVLTRGLKGFNKEELTDMLKSLQSTYPNVMVRGI